MHINVVFYEAFIAAIECAMTEVEIIYMQLAP